MVKNEVKKRKRIISTSFSDRVFDISNIIINIILLHKFFHKSTLVNVIFWIKGFTLKGYEELIKYEPIWIGFRNSIFYTVVGTIVNVFMTILCAYPLSRKDWIPRKFWLKFCLITMYFGGGMIPSYLVITAYGLRDTWWALVLPALINPFNMIIIKKFFSELPRELDEASYMDGATDLQVFTKVALPLSKPVIASISLFYGVGFWNDYFNAMIYLKTPELYPVQIQLRSIILLTSQITDMTMDYYDMNGAPPDKAVRMACTVIATIPILIVYPFVQKYFTKGVMVGAVKG